MWRARLDADALLTQIDVLVGKQRAGKHPHALLGDAVTLSSLGDRSKAFAMQLADTIAQGEFRFGPVQPTRVLIEGKWRVLYRANALDMIVSAALAADLSRLLDPTFSDALYSYRRGRSVWQAIAAFVAFVAQHRVANPDVRTRGLYVIRRDVKSYGEHIPVADESPLWPMLEAATQPDSFTLALLREAMSPKLSGEGVRVASVPTGSALQPLMCNLYLAPVDAIGSSARDGFYARVGDDILFAHSDPSVARDVAQRIEHAIAALGLELSEGKTQDLYFTGAGRRSDTWSGAQPTTHLQYLGARMDFRGGVGLKNDRARQLLQRLRRRVANTLALCGPDSADRASLACEVLGRALDPSHPAADPLAPLLLSVVNDRRQLRELDHWVALDVAQRVTGIHGPRAFRKLSYRALRREHRLPSMVIARQRRSAP